MGNADDRRQKELPLVVQQHACGEGAKRSDLGKDQPVAEKEVATGVRSPPPSSVPAGSCRRTGFFVFFRDARYVLRLDELGSEVARIAVPAALALAADPLASLVDTAFIGRIGPVELAGVGVSIAIFNQVSRIAIYPIVSVTTSFVAEEHIALENSAGPLDGGDVEKAASGGGGGDAKDDGGNCSSARTGSATAERRSPPVPPRADGNTGVSTFAGKKRYIPSVSSALVVGTVLGLVQTMLLMFAAKPLLHLMGVKAVSWTP